MHQLAIMHVPSATWCSTVKSVWGVQKFVETKRSLWKVIAIHKSLDVVRKYTAYFPTPPHSKWVKYHFFRGDNLPVDRIWETFLWQTRSNLSLYIKNFNCRISNFTPQKNPEEIDFHLFPILDPTNPEGFNPSADRRLLGRQQWGLICTILCWM